MGRAGFVGALAAVGGVVTTGGVILWFLLFVVVGFALGALGAVLAVLATGYLWYLIMRRCLVTGSLEVRLGVLSTVALTIVALLTIARWVPVRILDDAEFEGSTAVLLLFLAYGWIVTAPLGLVWRKRLREESGPRQLMLYAVVGFTTCSMGFLGSVLAVIFR